MVIKKGQWVQIRKVILQPEERSSNLPIDTKQVPFEMYVKGFLMNDAKTGDNVKILTVIGREVEGILVKGNPVYEHNFGKPIPELLSVGSELRQLLKEGGKANG